MGRFNCRSPFRRFIVERCAGAGAVTVAVAVASQSLCADSAQRSQPVPAQSNAGDCRLWTETGTGEWGLVLDGAVISAGLTEPINNRAECHA